MGSPALHDGVPTGACSLPHAPPVMHSSGFILSLESAPVLLSGAKRPHLPLLLPSAQDSLTPLPGRALSPETEPLGSARVSLAPGFTSVLLLLPSRPGPGSVEAQRATCLLLCPAPPSPGPWANLPTLVKASSQERSILCGDGNVL